MRLAILLLRWQRPYPGQDAWLLEMVDDDLDLLRDAVAWLQRQGDNGAALPYPDLVVVDELRQDAREALAELARAALYADGDEAGRRYSGRCAALDAALDD